MAKKYISGHYWVKPFNSDWTIGIYNEKSKNWYIIGNQYPFKTAYFEGIGSCVNTLGKFI